MQLILGSSSPYRKALLDRLHLPYAVAHPNIDEQALPGEAPLALVRRLALAKAEAIAKLFPEALIIGCDQVADLDGRILTKPAGHADAARQLQLCSGRVVTFQSALCLYNATTKRHQLDVVPFAVHYKLLTGEKIEKYLRKDQPYQCAGSIKSESLGIALFERMQGDDPNALLGLPLIRLIAMLEQEGVEVL